MRSPCLAASRSALPGASEPESPSTQLYAQAHSTPPMDRALAQPLACPDRSSDRSERFKRTVPEREARKHCSQTCKETKRCAPERRHRTTSPPPNTRPQPDSGLGQNCGAQEGRRVAISTPSRPCLFVSSVSVGEKPHEAASGNAVLLKDDFDPFRRFKSVHNTGASVAARARKNFCRAPAPISSVRRPGKHPTLASGNHRRVAVSNHH